MTHRIGQDFNKFLKLDLIPWTELKSGYWQVNISYITEENNTTMFHNATFNTYGVNSDFRAIVGFDVRFITITIHRHNSFPGSPSGIVQKTLSVHQLIMLNLASKLLKFKS